MCLNRFMTSKRGGCGKAGATSRHIHITCPPVPVLLLVAPLLCGVCACVYMCVCTCVYVYACDVIKMAAWGPHGRWRTAISGRFRAEVARLQLMG